MNLRGLGFLALRLLAIYMVVMGIRHAVDLVDFAIPTYMQWTDLGFAQALIIIGIPTILLWIIGILTWVMADKWSKHLIPAASGTPDTVIRIPGIESFVLSVVGLVLVILSVTDLIQSVFGFVWITNQEVHFNRQSYYYQFAGQAVEIILGAVLLLKSQGITVLLRKIRSAGLESKG